MLERVHLAVLVGFAALLGLVEGPAVIACGAVILTAVATGRLRRLRLTPVLAGLLVWLAAGVPGLVRAEHWPSSQDVTRPLFALAYLVGAYALAPADDRTLTRVAWAFGACIALNGAYGYLQLRYGALPLDGLLLKNPHSSQIWVPNHQLDPGVPGATGVRGVSGLYYHRLKLAHVGIVGFALLALVALSPHAKRSSRGLAALGGLALAGAIVLTYARTAVVAVALALATLAVVGARRRTLAAIVGLGAAAVGVATLEGTFLAERLRSIGADAGHRRTIFASALRMVADHPIFGVGHGVYRRLAPSYGPPGASGVWLTSPHDLFLQVLAETGVVGAAGFSAAVLVGLSHLARRVRRARGAAEGRAFLDRLALVAVVAVLALGVTHFPLHHAPVALVFWTFLGVADGGPWPRSPEAE